MLRKIESIKLQSNGMWKHSAVFGYVLSQIRQCEKNVYDWDRSACFNFFRFWTKLGIYWFDYVRFFFFFLFLRLFYRKSCSNQITTRELIRCISDQIDYQSRRWFFNSPRSFLSNGETTSVFKTFFWNAGPEVGHRHHRRSVFSSK